MKAYEKFLLYRNRFVAPKIDLGLRILNGVAFLLSLLFIIATIFSFGYDLTAVQQYTVSTIGEITWWVFLLQILLPLFITYQDVKRDYRGITWVLSFLFLFTLIPVIFKEPQESTPGIRFFWEIMNSELYSTSLLFFISFFNVSSSVVKLLGKKTNPALILAVSFIIIIFIGSGFLILPNCTVAGITWIDSLFVATSAVCVTGLSPVDLSTTFTPIGFTVILVLIQIGGLGVMTFTSFFAIFFMGDTSYSNHIALKDIVSSKSLNSLLSTLGYIFLFTLVIEGFGAFMIWNSVRGTLGMSLEEELAFSVFHAISSFCNAGISTMPDGLAHPLLINKNQLFIVLSALVILGGIGFPILVNLKDVVKVKVKRIIAFIKHKKPVQAYRLYDINTRIVLTTTTVLLLLGTLCIGFLEWNGVLEGLPVESKLIKSFFLAVCPRSAGFGFYDLNTFQFQTIILYIFLMWIGGASQSTAGGVKVNSIALVYLNISSMLKNSDRIEVFDRRVSHHSVQRAHATVFTSIFTLGLVFSLLTILEPSISPRELALESIAALSTCGAGLGVTPKISVGGKLILIVAMLLGRVGVLTILLGFIKKKPVKKYQYPSGEIIIS